MASRNRKSTPDLQEQWRKKIQSSALINRLIDHALGNCDMTSTQVRAAECLLKKTLPDLQATELNISGEIRQRVVSAQPMTDDEWTERYGNSLEPSTGATESTH